MPAQPQRKAKQPPTKPKPKPQPRNPKARQTRKRQPRHPVHRMAQQQVSGSMALAYLDPKDKPNPPHISSSLGNYTTVNSLSRVNLVTNTTADLYVVCSWTATDMSMIHFNDLAPYNVGVYTLPMLTSQPALSIRPLRSSIAVRNSTQLINTAGLVRVLNMNQSYDWGAAFATATTLTPATVLSFKNLVEGSPYTHSTTQSALVTGKTWVNYPISTVGYNTWQEYLAVAATGTQNALVTASKQETMSTVIFQFPATPTGQQALEFVVRRQDALRYAANSALAATARAPPISNQVNTELVIRAASEAAANPVEMIGDTNVAYARARRFLEFGVTAIGVGTQIARIAGPLVAAL